MLGPHVFLHVTFLCKSSATHMTSVRLLPSMRLGVNTQCIPSAEGSITMCTFVFADASMQLFMLVIHTASQKGLTAHIALEGAFFGVF